MNQQNPAYVIDANILISFRIFTPMNIHKIFWRRLYAAIASGRIILIKDVAEECKYEPLKGWVAGVKITKINDDLRYRALEINNTYSLITERDGIVKSKADPVIIAYAEKNNCTVFTHEAKRKSEQDPMKIPDACDKLGVLCKRWPDQVLENIMEPI